MGSNIKTSKFSLSDKEALSIMVALECERCWLIDNPFVCTTACQTTIGPWSTCSQPNTSHKGWLDGHSSSKSFSQ